MDLAAVVEYLAELVVASLDQSVANLKAGVVVVVDPVEVVDHLDVDLDPVEVVDHLDVDLDSVVVVGQAALEEELAVGLVRDLD